MGRKKIDWDSLEYKDYPLKNLLGKERRLQRMIEKRQGDIDKRLQELKDRIKKENQKSTSEMTNLRGDLRKVRLVIKEKSKDDTDSSIWVLRGGVNIRGKWRRFGIDKFVHIGKPDSLDNFTNTGKTYGKMTDEELIKIIKMKVGNSLTKSKKSKGVSIPIMITNKMRMSLSTLGYSKDEMKHLTPIESHKIINKGVPKKPSKDRNRNQ